ncbi:MAG: flagellar hook-associated protein FlgL [Armatimonadetes bacterium]|nr:flagellar hook-associated protein FlgL [Armatimonadota bacterium]
MRVPTFGIYQKSIRHLAESAARLDRAREQVSTGKRVLRPSDDPEAAGVAMAARAEVEQLTQFRQNTDRAALFLDMTESSLAAITEQLRKVRTTALQASTAALDAGDREALAQQVERLADRIAGLMNTETGGRYLFGGTLDAAPPFRQAAAGEPYVYNGNATRLEMGLAPDLVLPVSVAGSELVNERSDAAGAPKSLFQTLADLAKEIRAASPTAISARIADLDVDLGNITRLRADVGARRNYVELARERLDATLAQLRTRQSEAEDADLSAALIELQAAELANQATAGAAARLAQPTLLDFLR